LVGWVGSGRSFRRTTSPLLLRRLTMLAIDELLLRLVRQKGRGLE
jgi:hypothetical protein